MVLLCSFLSILLYKYLCGTYRKARYFLTLKVNIFGTKKITTNCKTKMKEYLSFYLYLLYLYLITYFDSPFDKFPKISIQTHFKIFTNSIFIYFLTLTVSIWRLVFGTPASLNLPRLLETTFHIFKILPTEKLPKCRMTKMRHRQLRPQRKPKRFQRPILYGHLCHLPCKL